MVFDPFKPFKAKYAGTCRVCRKPFAKGSQIRRAPGPQGGYVHVPCSYPLDDDDRIDNPGKYGKPHHMCD